MTRAMSYELLLACVPNAGFGMGRWSAHSGKFIKPLPSFVAGSRGVSFSWSFFSSHSRNSLLAPRRRCRGSMAASGVKRPPRPAPASSGGTCNPLSLSLSLSIGLSGVSSLYASFSWLVSVRTIVGSLRLLVLAFVVCYGLILPQFVR
ncbi:hypothetical protein DAI22_04g119600 [Oryza sativa Japonica Group]|nr:hypothetical protein DAI22_04g119600 [Oryza sativa Japonica Group]